MIKYNSNNLLVGQIKEILSTFNLPSYRVYTRKNELDFMKENKEVNIIPTIKSYLDSEKKIVYPEDMQYVPYIKDNKIQYYVRTGTAPNYTYAWENTNQAFSLDKKIKDWTKTLAIHNNIYDYYTHEYLGNYLRFKRDYEGIDLMPLYNCFSDRICTALNYTFTLTEEQPSSTVSFNTNNKSFKIYMLPVKLFQEYTIAIDSQTEIEICCGIYGKYQNTALKFDKLPKNTYQKYNKLLFNHPVVYDKLLDIKELDINELAKNEMDLKLFIKLPATNSSSIVVLEGNYLHYNDSILKFMESSNINEAVATKSLKRIQNYTVTNFDTTVNDFADFKPITSLQLLRLNTKEQYPFADRLIEYLLGNAIDSSEEIVDNIRRVQKVINLNTMYPDPNMSIWNNTTKQFEIKPGRLSKKLIQNTDGVWNNAIRAIVYDKFNTTLKPNINDINHDILGYVDKDIEECYRANSGEKDAKKNIIFTTISSIDLYTDKDGLYNDSLEENK